MSFYLVTGGAGFIGSNLTKRLLELGHSVRVLDNYSAGHKVERHFDGVEYVKGDIRNLDDVVRATEGVEGVFHLAAVPRVPYSVEHPTETTDINITGTSQLVEAAVKSGVRRVVFSSSSSVYGGDKGQVHLSEDMICSPKSPYALQKYCGEHMMRIFSELFPIDTVSLRYFNVYGPLLDPDGAYALVVGKFLKMRKLGQPLTICGDGEYFRDYTHVSDIVEANIAAMTHDAPLRGEIFNVGAGEATSVNQVADLIGGDKQYVPARAGDVRFSLAANTKAEKILGFKPKIKFSDGILMLKKEWGV